MIYILVYLVFGFIVTGFVLMLDSISMSTRPFGYWEDFFSKNPPPNKEGSMTRILINGTLFWPILLFLWVKSAWNKRTLIEQAVIDKQIENEENLRQKVMHLLPKLLDWPPTKKKWLKIKGNGYVKKAWLYYAELPSGFVIYTHYVFHHNDKSFSAWRTMFDRRVNLPIITGATKRNALSLCEKDWKWSLFCHPLLVHKQIEAWREQLKFMQDNDFPLPFDIDAANKIVNDMEIEFQKNLDSLMGMGSDADLEKKPDSI